MHKWVNCHAENHGEAIKEIFNEQIRHGTALYDLQEKTADDIDRWFATKADQQLPIIGVEDGHGTLLGFASLSRFRPQQATARTYEHSLYVTPEARGQGLGKQLLNALINEATQVSAHCLVGVIDADNQQSIAMHKKAGFTEQGRLNQIAYKFDRWLDAVFMQRFIS